MSDGQRSPYWNPIMKNLAPENIFSIRYQNRRNAQRPKWHLALYRAAIETSCSKAWAPFLCSIRRRGEFDSLGWTLPGVVVGHLSRASKILFLHYNLPMIRTIELRYTFFTIPYDSKKNSTEKLRLCSRDPRLYSRGGSPSKIEKAWHAVDRATEPMLSKSLCWSQRCRASGVSLRALLFISCKQKTKKFKWKVQGYVPNRQNKLYSSYNYLWLCRAIELLCCTPYTFWSGHLKFFVILYMLYGAKYILLTVSVSSDNHVLNTLRYINYFFKGYIFIQ